MVLWTIPQIVAPCPAPAWVKHHQEIQWFPPVPCTAAGTAHDYTHTERENA